MPFDMTGLPQWAVILILVFRVFFTKGGAPAPAPVPTPTPDPAGGGILQRILDGINRLHLLLPNLIPQLPASPASPAASIAQASQAIDPAASPAAGSPSVLASNGPASTTAWIPVDIRVSPRS